MSQISLADAEHAGKRKKTWRWMLPGVGCRSVGRAIKRWHKDGTREERKCAIQRITTPSIANASD